MSKNEDMDMMGEIEPVTMADLDRLMEQHKVKAEECKSWEKYLSAHGLANFCFIREPTEVRKKQIYEIEESWYENQHPLTREEHQAMTQTHKQLLLDVRETTRGNFRSLEGKLSTLAMDDSMFSAQNLNNMDIFSQDVSSITKACNTDFMSFVEQVLQSSVDLLGKIGLEPPCSFAIIGLGSVAEGDANSYLDLEYAILVESANNLEYFHKLTADITFRVSNLGEMPLKSYDITELIGGRAEDLTTIDDHSIIGFKICNAISTRNQHINKCKTRIFTEKGMLDFYSQGIESSTDDEGISIELATSTALLTYGDGQMLYDTFHNLRTTYECKEDTSGRVVAKYLSKLAIDAKKYPLLSMLNFDQNIHKVKAETFRYPLLLVKTLRSMLALHESDPWDILVKLIELEILTEEKQKFLNFALAASIYIRSCVFLSHNSRQEWLTFRLDYDRPEDCSNWHHIPQKLFVIMGCVLVPIAKALRESVDKERSNTVSTSVDALKSVIQSFHVMADDFILKAEILNHTGDYVTAYQLLVQKLGKTAVHDRCENFSRGVREHYCAMSATEDFEHHAVELAAIIFYNFRDFHTARVYFHFLIVHDERSHRSWMYKHMHALCSAHLGDYQEAQTRLKRIITEITDRLKIETHKSPYDYVIEQLDQACELSVEEITAINFIVDVLMDLSFVTWEGNFDEHCALKEAVESANLANAINNILFHTGSCALEKYHIRLSKYWDLLGSIHRENKAKESLEYHRKSLDLKLKIYGERTNHQEIARGYSSLGLAHQATNNLEDALNCHLKSLAMKKALHLHSETAESYSYLSLVYSLMKMHGNAMQYSRKASEMMEEVRIENRPQPQSANIHQSTGNVLAAAGYPESALKYYRKALFEWRMLCNDSHGDQLNAIHSFVKMANICLEIYDKKPEPSMTDIYKSIMTTRTSRIGQQNCVRVEATNKNTMTIRYEEAIKHYLDVIELSKSTYGEEHKVTIELYDGIAKIYNKCGQHEKARDCLFPALENTKKVFIEQNHPITQSLRVSLATAYEGMFEYGLAIYWYTEVLRATDETEDTHGIFMVAMAHFYIAKNFLRLHKVAEASVHALDSITYSNLLSDERETITEWYNIYESATNLSEALKLVIICQEKFPKQSHL